jgi:hypothetical protein
MVHLAANPFCTQRESLIDTLYTCSAMLNDAIRELAESVNVNDFQRCASTRAELHVIRDHMKAIRREIKEHRALHGC